MPMERLTVNEEFALQVPSHLFPLAASISREIPPLAEDATSLDMLANFLCLACHQKRAPAPGSKVELAQIGVRRVVAFFNRSTEPAAPPPAPVSYTHLTLPTKRIV
eukprot:TRINITY_DN5220_c0_g1_i2.p1 TRINITY_DN5220_c0_g1~~TRINITY_DN5220_c0_g1_i2.p1  ORF type:complete len:106 (+),score=18.95 TRINITY_DN5220_c0_g1_i2:315-632(+)